MSLLSRSTPVLIAGALLVGSTGGAVAGSMITGSQIKNHTVTTQDLSSQTVKQLRGLTGFATVRKQSSSIPDGSSASVTATCPGSKQVLGATAFWDNQHAPVEIFPSGTTSVTTYQAFAENNSGSTDLLTLVLNCASIS